jgi:hypothetical protein
MEGTANLIGTGAQIAAKGFGDRASRRFTERLSALESLNAYKQFIAKMMAEDPAKWIKQALQGQTRKNFYTQGKFGKTMGKPGKGVDPSEMQSGWDMLPPETASLLSALADPSSYGLSKNAQGGYTYTAPTYSPAVSEKYKKHLGGIATEGKTIHLSQALPKDGG